MQWTDIHLSSAAVSLGRRETTAQAVAEGRYSAEQNEVDGYLAVRVADRAPTIELAVEAANLALERTAENSDGEEFALVTHSGWTYQGMDNFAPASYVQSRTVRGAATALEINQYSNGGMAALELAAAYLTAKDTVSRALVTTSDRFVPPAYDRYHTDSGFLFGDAGTALVLSRRPGVARLLTTSSLGDTTYGGAYIGAEPWSDAHGAAGFPVDLARRKEQYIAEHGADVLYDVFGSINRNYQLTVDTALEEADLKPGDIARWAFPNLGRSLVDWEWRKSMGITDAQTNWEWARQVGHLGPGDQFANLTHLLETSQVRVGDKVLLSGIGIGFTFRCAVVEITALPEWSLSAG